MNLAIVGYGKMGRLIDQLAPEYGFTVTQKLDEFNNPEQRGMTLENFRGVPVAIEFSTPETVVPNVRRLAEMRVHCVIGTTGWLSRIDEVRDIVTTAGTGLVWSPNYSIGVNVFSRLVREAARLLQDEKEYEAWAWEIHHSAKLDAPSGTLIKLVHDMRAGGYTAPIDQSASRAGQHPGTHEIGFDSAADTITLRHSARSREGFARGALKAAQWIAIRPGFHEFSDILFAPKQ